ncbi:MAG: hypothetical protein K9G24_01760 [Candidatus Nanopelagicales bacterium]|nr:hypothetical protein [Candidatus Nanopelagicales bacterium]MCF8536802.1 hypothetical protein [Candidatus Nanopelagicales bacterium]MCF8541787.1 hypothetical protein [Candidatus Nanopelagicales bacterium]MCF8556172.1 hypothetical protein [Candidatus Nanopelagicales bacterium]
MTLLSGTALVLLSWAVMLGAAIGVGMAPALMLRPGRRGLGLVRGALWWGIAILAVLISGVSLVLPMRSGLAAVVVVVVAVALVLAGVVAVRVAGGRSLSPRRCRRAPSTWIIVGALAAAVLYLAAAALGPVTNYDTGLYHLGAIAYAGEYRAIPGLANLYFPFGYANAEFPIAAFLGNGPWDGVGYRLLNGVLLAAMALDLGLRVRCGRMRAGSYVLAVGTASAFVPMVALSDYWVTSPTSDSAVLVLSIVSAAYLADAVTAPTRAAPDGAVAAVTAVLAVMLRPTMAVFAATTVMVVLMVVWRTRRAGRRVWLVLVLTSTLAVFAAIVTTLRDVILSGWLQYPLSVFAFAVPWRAPDPTQFRVPTLGAARDLEDLWAAAEGWGWVAAWFGRLPRQWETYEFAALALAAIVLMVLASRSRVALRTRPLLLVMVPSATAFAFWWVATPPSYRFIWGPLFTLAAIPAGWALWRLTLPGAGAPAVRGRWQWITVLSVALPIAMVVGFSAVTRFDVSGLTEQRTWTLGIEIPYAVAPVIDVPVAEQTLPSGLTVLVPTESDQCWLNYPLCTAQIDGLVSLRGTGIQEGFLP